MEPKSWRWAHAQGLPRAVSLSELRASLSNGSILPHAWVWQRGWKHWLPACKVQELRYAVGKAHAREPEVPALDPGQLEPPPVPALEESQADIPRHSTPVPPPYRARPLQRRAPSPTVSEDGFPGVTATETLRPPGAVPPPPRAVPRSMLHRLEDWDPAAYETPPPPKSSDSVASPIPDARVAEEDALPRELLRPAAPNGHSPSPLAETTGATAARRPEAAPDERLSVPDAETSAPIHPPLDDGSITYDPDANLTHNATASAHATGGAATSNTLQGRPKFLALAALVAGALSLAAGAWLVFSSKTEARHVTPSRLDTTPTTDKPLVCRIEKAAQRVSPRIQLSVGPIARSDVQPGSVALGFAETATTAAGITVDATDLDVKFPYREAKDKKLVSVTPQVLSNSLSFVSVRADIELSQARALDTRESILLGVTSAGIARQLQGQRPEVVWPLESGASVTDPRVVAVSGLGHAVTYRQGGQSGRCWLGFLTASGTSQSPPVAIESGANFVGNPTLAASSNGTTLVAFAGRSTEALPWSIYLSLAPASGPLAPTVQFELPAGGPGGDAISPSVVDLPDEHFLLQWSEGSAGSRVVRVQLLDGKLRPLGTAHTVSPAPSNSGQGLLWASGARAVSFFVVSSGKLTELWATALTCAR